MPSISRHDLFGVAPEEFVAARDALVRELKAAGAKEDAGEIKRLRRPSWAAWALNQVSGTNPEAVQRLLAASTAARDAQVKGGTGGRLREVLADWRTTLDEVEQLAREVVATSGRNADGRELHDGLTGVLSSSSLREEFERGELTTVIPPDDVESDLVSELAASMGDAPVVHRSQHIRADLQAARDRLAEANDSVSEADAAVTRADKELDRARRTLDQARGERDRAAVEVERQEHRLAEARPAHE